MTRKERSKRDQREIKEAVIGEGTREGSLLSISSFIQPSFLLIKAKGKERKKERQDKIT